MQRLTRKTLISVGCIVSALAVGVRIYYQLVPRGVEFTPFTEYSRQLPSVTAPNGKTYEAFVNDAGALHSGNYWTWIIDNHWLTGRYVATEGYLTSEYASGDTQLTVEWDGDVPKLPFKNERY